eukprot:4557393-Amphidinium_carterae.1
MPRLFLLLLLSRPSMNGCDTRQVKRQKQLLIQKSFKETTLEETTPTYSRRLDQETLKPRKT